MAIKGLAGATPRCDDRRSHTSQDDQPKAQHSSISNLVSQQAGWTSVQQPLGVVMAKVDAEIFTQGARADRDHVQVL